MTILSFFGRPTGLDHIVVGRVAAKFDVEEQLELPQAIRGALSEKRKVWVIKRCMDSLTTTALPVIMIGLYCEAGAMDKARTGSYTGAAIFVDQIGISSSDIYKLLMDMHKQVCEYCLNQDGYFITDISSCRDEFQIPGFFARAGKGMAPIEFSDFEKPEDFIINITSADRSEDCPLLTTIAINMAMQKVMDGATTSAFFSDWANDSIEGDFTNTDLIEELDKLQLKKNKQIATLNKKYGKQSTEKASVEKSLIDSENYVKSLEENLDSARTAISMLRQSIVDMEVQISKNMGVVNLLGGKIKILEGDNNELTNANAELKSKWQKGLIEIMESKTTLGERDRSIVELKSEVERLNKERGRLEGEIRVMTHQVNAAEKAVENFKNEIATSRQKHTEDFNTWKNNFITLHNEGKAELAASVKKFDSLKIVENDRAIKLGKLQTEYEKLKTEREAVVAENILLKEKISSIESTVTDILTQINWAGKLLKAEIPVLISEINNANRIGEIISKNMTEIDHDLYSIRNIAEQYLPYSFGRSYGKIGNKINFDSVKQHDAYLSEIQRSEAVENQPSYAWVWTYLNGNNIANSPLDIIIARLEFCQSKIFSFPKPTLIVNVAPWGGINMLIEYRIEKIVIWPKKLM